MSKDHSARKDRGRHPDAKESENSAADVGDQAFPKTETYNGIFSDDSDAIHPLTIGRYRCDTLLGRGAFGCVYLAHDDDLRRRVAIKVPREGRLVSAKDFDQFLAEARTLARLDHKNIVPVFDVGRTDDGECYVVSKFIEGSDLAKRMKSSRFSYVESAELIATTAEALHYAHTQRIVHRDVKPANILLDSAGWPYVCDFGLALREEDFGKRQAIVGTAYYMSPEQARNEGHLVDGRSDIFSLGVVLYELLTGLRPFRGDTTLEILERVKSLDAQPLRQLDDKIPKELERVCLKALAKRISDRYETALDMSGDLRAFLQLNSSHSTETANTSTSSSQLVDSISLPPMIIPRGLSSFGAEDADFFLNLLPGPFDRDGIPDNIRFWKSWIETNSREQSFRVGLIYGPSGSGKSSFVIAGLLPLLHPRIIPIHVECTSDTTEEKLLNRLRAKFSNLGTASLPETLVALRQGGVGTKDGKVLLVFDQFEQWLHANRNETDTELVQALRQCDGTQIQALLIVRDDFWMAVTRFIRELEIRLEKENCTAIDLFSLRHARKILAAFGCAYGALPQPPGKLDEEQEKFLREAVEGLAEGGAVIPVRLALFAEMVKNKTWSMETLREIGGIQGVGAAFLESAFNTPPAHPEHRLHQQAAREVLQALLPEPGLNIKGHMRPAEELLIASGYQSRPDEFEILIRILDNELRLITPSDQTGHNEQQSSTSPEKKFFQLTHDYLVPSLREWLTQKQRETRKGRAILHLSDRTSMWMIKKESKQLPSLWEWLDIRFYTQSRTWNDAQRLLMRGADKHHLARFGVFGVSLGIVIFVTLFLRHNILQKQQLDSAEVAVKRLMDANIAQVPEIIHEIDHKNPWIDITLKQALVAAEARNDHQGQTRASLALLSVDHDQAQFLERILLDAGANEAVLIRDGLLTSHNFSAAPYWELVEDPESSRAHRLRAACVLAVLEPEDERWRLVREDIVAALLSESELAAHIWAESFRPVQSWLKEPLTVAYHQAQDSNGRNVAAVVLAEIFSDQPNILIQLVPAADNRQLNIVAEKLRAHESQIIPLLRDLSINGMRDSRAEQAPDTIALQKANAIIALVLLGHTDELWPHLSHASDQSLATFLIHLLGPNGVDPLPLLDRIENEQDAMILRGLLLSFGEFPSHQLTMSLKESLIAQATKLFWIHPDPGVHSAAEWLLQKWDVHKTQIDSFQTEESKTATHRRQWYLTGKGHTMAIVIRPVEFQMGSPLTEKGREDDERIHTRRIPRTFAISTKEITRSQFRKFDDAERKFDDAQKSNDQAICEECPVSSVSYVDAVRYCRWLSVQEGIGEEQMCYPRLDALADKNITPYPDFLDRTGYRLPTEAEWEYACRAGTETSRFFGDTDRMMPSYAWFAENSQGKPWSVGLLKPNSLGLFDIYGNMDEWCVDAFRWYPSTQSNTKLDVPSGKSNRLMVKRGGGFINRADNLRSASRTRAFPNAKMNSLGFRIARTMSEDF